MLELFDRLKLTPAERRLVVVIFAVVFVVLNYWLFWPRFGDFKLLSEEIATLERKRDLQQKEVDRRPAYEVILRKLQAAGSVLPAGEERILFRSDMERLSRELGLSVPRWGEVLPEKTGTATNAFFEAIGLTMSQVSGTEEQFVEFLYRVGASNSTIRVKELTLAPGGFDTRSQGKTNLIGTLKLVASVQKAAPKPAPGAPSTITPVPPVSPGAGAVSTNRGTAAVRMPSVRTNAAPPPARPEPRTIPPAGPAASRS